MERLSIAGPSTVSVSGIFLGSGQVERDGSSVSLRDSDGSQGVGGSKSKKVGFASENGLWGPSACDSQGKGQWPLGSQASDRSVFGVRW